MTRTIDTLRGFDGYMHMVLLHAAYVKFGENPLADFANYQPTKDCEANGMVNYLSHVINPDGLQVFRLLFRALIIRELKSYIATGIYDRELVKTIFTMDMEFRGDTVGMKQIDYFLIAE